MTDQPTFSSSPAPVEKLSFGFKPAIKSTPLVTHRILLETDDDDKDNDNPTGLVPGKKSATPISKAEKKKHQEAQQMDSTVFDYDSAYDAMKQAERKVKQSKQQESSTRKPKYIENFLESAQQRKRDRVRTEARMIRKEREAEGDEFADKETFVTNAYKQQQAELAKEEEQEKKQNDGPNIGGMQTFYRDMLNQTSAIKEAAIAASLETTAAATTTTTHDGDGDRVNTIQEADETSDLQLALAARQKGLQVELNDDNQIVDKRDLLNKGLNILSSKRRQQDQESSTPMSQEEERAKRREDENRRRQEYEARINRDSQRQRQSVLIQEQMLQLERQRQLEEQEQLENEKQKATEKRNDQAAISDAKQRYLERRRKKTEPM